MIKTKRLKKAKNRRGAVIELTVLLMSVVVIMSVLLTSTMVLLTNHKNKELKKVEQKVKIDQIAHEYISTIIKGNDIESFTTENGEYSFDYHIDGQTLSISIDDLSLSEKALEAIVVVTEQGYVINSWQY